MAYVIAIVVVGGLIAFFVLWAKRTARECEELVAGLSDEVKAKLAMTDVVFEGKNEWTQDAVIAKIIDKGNKVDLKLIWHNKTMQQQNSFDQPTLADLTIKKEELEAHSLKEGSFVKMHLAPEKTVGMVTLRYDD